MLAGFTPDAIDAMDPVRRQRLLWRLSLEPWRQLMMNPFLTEAGHTVVDLNMLPQDLLT